MKLIEFNARMIQGPASQMILDHAIVKLVISFVWDDIAAHSLRFVCGRSSSASAYPVTDSDSADE